MVSLLFLVDWWLWYPWALSGLGLRWEHVTFGVRNLIERLFRALKEGTNSSMTTSSILKKGCIG